MAFKMFATVRAPPMRRKAAGGATLACFSTSWSSSVSADCGTSLSEAMRISTSVRISSDSSGNMPADCSGSRCDSTMAPICGCSALMICATAFESIHLSASMPWPVWPVDTRSSSKSVFCLPTAWVSTRRT